MLREKLAKKAIMQMKRRLTDEVFLLIQNDASLMYEYLKAVEKEGLTQVNQHIGKAVKDAFRLENAPERQKQPRSTLIKSHQIFAED